MNGRQSLVLAATCVIVVARGMGLALGAEDKAAPMDRTDFRIYASHATEGDEFKIENAIDGDESTKWVGEGHPLPWQPANVVLQFPQDRPVAVQGVILLTQTLRDVLALKRFEIFAWGSDGEGWAGAEPLAVVEANESLRVVIDFPAVQTSRLRLRIHDTWRADHAFPRLAEIDVIAATQPAEARLSATSPVPGEKISERLLLARAMGTPVVFPGEPYNAEKGYLHYARTFLDTMIREGTDRYGPQKSPMVASILDMDSHELPEDPPANIPGQRFGDRSIHGGNLFHDAMLLLAGDHVSGFTNDDRFRRSTTDYLTSFLRHCPHQATGLFPWGEHAYWDFRNESPGRLTHEFIGGLPLAFWERLWEIDPVAVRGEADGLMNHVVNLRTFAFDRHAAIDRALPVPRPPGMGFLDFPRHAGFYVGTWAFAYRKTGEQKYLDWSMKLIDHHWRSRHPQSGLLPTCTHGAQAQEASSESMLSFAVSLLEAGEWIGLERAEGERCRTVGRALVEAVLALPHRPEAGQFLTTAPIDASPERLAGEALDAGASSRPFEYRYGGGFTADDAVLLLAVHRLTREPRALALAGRFADYYRTHEPPEPTEIVPARVYASIIGLYLDLYELKRDPADLLQAERYAQLAISRLFYGGLFRGATGINHYESDMMVGNLVYNLVWLHALKADPAKEIVSPNYFNR